MTTFTALIAKQEEGKGRGVGGDREGRRTRRRGLYPSFIALDLSICVKEYANCTSLSFYPHRPLLPLFASLSLWTRRSDDIQVSLPSSPPLSSHSATVATAELSSCSLPADDEAPRRCSCPPVSTGQLKVAGERSGVASMRQNEEERRERGGRRGYLHPIQRQSVNRGCSSFFAESKPCNTHHETSAINPSPPTSTLLCILHHKRAAIPHCKAADQSLPRRLRLLVSTDRLRDRLQFMLLQARLHLLLVLLQGQPHHLLLLLIQHQLLRDRLMQRKVLGRSILELTVSVRHNAREQRDPACHVPHRL